MLVHLFAIIALLVMAFWYADSLIGGEFIYLIAALPTLGFAIFWHEQYPDPEWMAMIFTITFGAIALFCLMRVIVSLSRRVNL